MSVIFLKRLCMCINYIFQDLLRACDVEVTTFRTRLIAATMLSFVCIIHGGFLKAGLRLQNALGTLGLLNLIVVAFSGLLAKTGIIQLKGGRELPHNFDGAWEGTRLEANAIVTGLMSIVWYALESHTIDYI